MSSLLKDLYSKQFYDRFTGAVATVVPGFNRQQFIRFIFDADWQQMELKERMRHTSLALRQFLPGDFEKAAAIITDIIKVLRKNGVNESGIEYIFLPDYIELYGIDHFDTSVKAIEQVTQFITCEFAVRPFIIRYGDKMIRQMQNWSLHKNEKVRRLASEGIRPRLPWAIALPALKKDPAPIFPILENLKNDPSAFVRRSVANNLNDISKDHPQLVASIAHQWKGISEETDAIIKHGCRTLLKQAHPAMMKYYGFLNSEGLKVSAFKINTPLVKIGNSLEFSFSLKNTDDKRQTVRLEYGVYYRKKNGALSKKIFKISERPYRANEKFVVLRRQSFRNITTRKFYAGDHKLSIIINGQERKLGKFKLVN
jgi:3-methyladenine DNA glycosylase AlkC